MFEVFSVAYILNIWGLFYSQLCYFLHLWCFVSTQRSVRNFSQQCAHIFIEFLSLYWNCSIPRWQSIVFTHKTRWSVAVKSVVRLQLSSNHFFWAPLYFLSKACLLPTYSIYFMTVIDRCSIAFYVPLIFNVLSLLIYLNFHEISQLD